MANPSPELAEWVELYLAKPTRRAADPDLHRARERSLVDALQATLDDWLGDNPLDPDAPHERR